MIFKFEEIASTERFKARWERLDTGANGGPVSCPGKKGSLHQWFQHAERKKKLLVSRSYIQLHWGMTIHSSFNILSGYRKSSRSLLVSLWAGFSFNQTGYINQRTWTNLITNFLLYTDPNSLNFLCTGLSFSEGCRRTLSICRSNHNASSEIKSYS